MQLYQEPPEKGYPYRKGFLNQVEALLERQYAQAETRRAAFFAPDTSSVQAYQTSIEAYREQFKAMLGWPLTLPSTGKVPAAREQYVAEDDLGRISRLWIEALPGVETYGLLFLPPREGPHPLVLSQHGGLGTPELCSNFFGSANYNDMSRRVLRRGVAVFAPQLFRWREEYGPKHDWVEIDRQLKQLGGSIAALEIYCLQRSLDHLVTRNEIDGTRIGMIGLSYGGFHTLFASALDTRIGVAVSSCFFNDRKEYSGHDWTWFNAAHTFFDAEVAALVCPRPLYIEVGEKDEGFGVASARPEAAKVARVYEKLGIPERFRYHEHPGGHELDKGEGGIAFLCQHLRTGSAYEGGHGDRETDR